MHGMLRYGTIGEWWQRNGVLTVFYLVAVLRKLIILSAAHDFLLSDLDSDSARVHRCGRIRPHSDVILVC